MNAIVRRLRANDFNESGKLFTYTILSYESQDSKEISGRLVKYRGVCNFRVAVEGQESVQYNGVKVSSLLAYQISINPEKYINIEFSSYNTSPDFVENPLKFHISEDCQYYNLGFVTERGSVDVTVSLPGGATVVTKKFLYHKPENFLRFYQKRTSERAV